MNKQELFNKYESKIGAYCTNGMKADVKNANDELDLLDLFLEYLPSDLFLEIINAELPTNDPDFGAKLKLMKKIAEGDNTFRFDIPPMKPMPEQKKMSRHEAEELAQKSAKVWTDKDYGGKSNKLEDLVSILLLCNEFEVSAAEKDLIKRFKGENNKASWFSFTGTNIWPSVKVVKSRKPDPYFFVNQSLRSSYFDKKNSEPNIRGLQFDNFDNFDEINDLRHLEKIMEQQKLIPDINPKDYIATSSEWYDDEFPTMISPQAIWPFFADNMKYIDKGLCIYNTVKPKAAIYTDYSMRILSYFPSLPERYYYYAWNSFLYSPLEKLVYEAFLLLKNYPDFEEKLQEYAKSESDIQRKRAEYWLNEIHDNPQPAAKRYFISKNNKEFWNISQLEICCIIEHGELVAKYPQRKTEYLMSVGECKRFIDEKIKEQKTKGYKEVDENGVENVIKARSKKAATPSDVVYANIKRTFIYTDDKSNKFWTIEVSGDSYTVNYGKTGTTGQTQSKDFANEAACQKAADKLIAEKTKKGYVEQGGDDIENGEPTEIPTIEGLKENQIAVDLNNVADMKRVLTMLITNIKHWNKVVYNDNEIEYGQLVDGEFETYDSNRFTTGEEAFFAAAVQHKELLPLVEKYSKVVDPNQFFQDDLRMGMNAVFRLALNNEKYIPLFIEHHRKIRPGGGDTQMDHILELLSNSDNGLRLLAACSMYAIDQQNIEEGLGYWIEEYIGDDEEYQEKFFNYMMLEADKESDAEFRNTYVMEALDAMGVEYDEDTLAEILNDIDPENLPSIDELGEGEHSSNDDSESDSEDSEDDKTAFYMSIVNHSLSHVKPQDIENENWSYNSVHGFCHQAFINNNPEILLTDKAKQFIADNDYYYFDDLLRFCIYVLRTKTLGENSFEHLKQFIAGMGYYLPNVDLGKAAEIIFNDNDGEYVPKRKEILQILGAVKIEPLTDKPFKVVVKGVELNIPADFGLAKRQPDTTARVKHEIIDGTDYLFFVEGELLILENNHFELSIVNKDFAFGKMVNYGGYTNLSDRLTACEMKKYAAFASWRTYMRKTMKEYITVFGVTGGVVKVHADVADDYVDEFFSIVASVKPASAPIKKRLLELSK